MVQNQFPCRFVFESAWVPGRLLEPENTNPRYYNQSCEVRRLDSGDDLTLELDPMRRIVVSGSGLLTVRGWSQRSLPTGDYIARQLETLYRPCLQDPENHCACRERKNEHPRDRRGKVRGGSGSSPLWPRNEADPEQLGMRVWCATGRGLERMINGHGDGVP